MPFFRIKGNSLSPHFKGGELVFGTKPNRFFQIKKNDIVTFKHEPIGTMIKIVQDIDRDSLYVIGTNPNSFDSRQFGSIKLSNVESKILFKIPFL